MLVEAARIRRRGAGGGGGTDSFGTPPDWQYVGDPGQPALENGFLSIADLSPGNTKASFARVGDYLLIGGLFLGPANTTIFTLPVGFRPDWPVALFAACVDLSGSGDRVFDGIVVETDGSVVSGSNPLGYSSFLFATIPLLHPLTQPERSV